MSKVLILGTGGTIAGEACDPGRSWVYRAGQIGVDRLVGDLSDRPEWRGLKWVTQQVAQLDSKDMGWPVWQALGRALEAAMADDSVSAVVITHGTDTLEETACLLHALHDGRKPIVLTAAMRPAGAPDADGPANLLQAVRLAWQAAQRAEGGVAVAMAGRVWSARDVRKAHSHAIDAFDGGGAAQLEGEAPWPAPQAQGWRCLLPDRPPRVELLTSHADADGWLVDAMLAQARLGGERLDGLVVAGTGHGTVHEGLESALQRARQEGVLVWRSSRVARGGVLPRDGDAWPAAGAWTAAQARVMLVLALLSERR